MEADDGNFYGTTTQFGGRGTVYRVDTLGNLATVYAFGDSFSGDAEGDGAGLVQAADGYLYGTSRSGGSGGYGAVYRLDLAGNETVLHSLPPGSAGGYLPKGALLEASDGYLYGTASLGGAWGGGGTVFRIDPAAVVPVLTISPSSGVSEGQTPVQITGAGFQTGASVMVGSWPASDVTVVSPTELTATITFAGPGSLCHVAVINPDGTEGSLAKAWFSDFYDVPQGDIFHADVEKIFRDGVTAGCGYGIYCRDSAVTRAQMAVFLLRSLLGFAYVPPPASGTVFADVAADSFAAAWIEDLASRGVTVGCGGGNYCPASPVTREQMAVFLLKTLLGSLYEPPAASGTMFDDVPAAAFAADWIEDLAGRGITGGCQAAPPLYCPASATLRGQMAAFLANTFGLP